MEKKIEKTLSKILLTVSAAALAMATIIIFISVILRYFFKVSYSWMEEICRYLCIWSAFSVSGHIIFWNKDVTLDILSNTIKNPKAKWFLQIFNSAVLAGISGAVSVYGWKLWGASAGQKTYSNNFPMQLPYAIIPAGMGITCVFCVLKIVLLWREKSCDYFEFSAGKEQDERREE